MKRISSRHERALRLLALAVLVAAFFLPALARAADVQVFGFDGTAQVVSTTSNNAIALGTGQETNVPSTATPNTGDFIGAFSASTPLSIGAGYSGPAIYGGYWVNSTDLNGYPIAGKSALSRFRIDAGALSVGMVSHDAQAGHSADGTNVVTSGAVFMAFQTGATATTHYGLDLNSSVAVNATAVSSQDDARLVMEVGGQWYVSNLSITQANQTFSGSALLGTDWAAWDPNGGANGRLGDMPADYDVSGSSFNDIEAIGYLVELPSASANKTLDVAQFSADLNAEAVPEPSTVAMLSLGAVVLFLMVRRQRRELFPGKR